MAFTNRKRVLLELIHGNRIRFINIKMKNKMVELLLVLQLISVCIAVNPCVDYVYIYMADGLRSSDFDSRNSQVSLCDAYLDPATWYRFEHDAGNRLVERPVEPWYCGTQAPIWLNGTHPTDKSEVAARVCATFSSENICGWSGTIRIRLCNESGSEYFVYQLAVPPGCPLAYCVDAATRKQCSPPLVWLDDEFRCAVSETTTEHSTVPQKTSTPMAATSTSSTDRQSLTPTPNPSTVSVSETTTEHSTAPLKTSTPIAATSTFSIDHQSSTPTSYPSTEPTTSGWGPWGPWSVCSKPCDYGDQLRRRTCGRLPCEGPANAYRLCNEYNCQSLPEEKTRGIGLVFKYRYSDSKEDTMLGVVLNQPRIDDIIRNNINDVCSQNVSMCCGSQYNGVSPLYTEFVLSDDIYPAQGSIKPRTVSTAYYQVIAIVNEDVDRAICKGHSQRIHARQMESSENVLPLEVMLMASIKAADNIFEGTGLVVTEYIDPATMIEDNNGEDSQVACPSLTCVLPIRLSVTVIVLAVAIGGFCFARYKWKPRTKRDAPPSPVPPHYKDVSWTDLRVNIKGLPYIVPPPSQNVSGNVYYTLNEAGSVDFQKMELDV